MSLRLHLPEDSCCMSQATAACIGLLGAVAPSSMCPTAK